jgi:sensor c-di-GMP phosphodiesterase-like protein
LWRFPFDKIKIDRSFMQGFDGSGREAKTVVKTIIALGRELNMRVTVEGVETATQAAFLDKADGDQAQGYFFGRPVPATEVSAQILADFQKRSAAPSLATTEEARRVSENHRHVSAVETRRGPYASARNVQFRTWHLFGLAATRFKPGIDQPLPTNLDL